MNVERKWWFVALVGVLTVCVTRFLLVSAGLPATPASVSQFVLYLFCFVGVWKVFSFAGWLLALRWTVPRR